MDESRIRVIKPFVGGGFGARVEVLNFEIVTALLARAAGGKVLMQLTREETFLTHRGAAADRHPAEARHDGATAASPPASARWCSAAAPMPATASSPSSMPARCCRASTTFRRSNTTAIASMPTCRPAARCAVTARSIARHAFECLLDRMARELELDPFAVRRANLLRAPTRTLNDLMVNSYGLARMPRQGRARERLARAHRQAAAGQRPRHGLLALRQRRRQADPLDRRAARRRQPAHSISTAASRC